MLNEDDDDDGDDDESLKNLYTSFVKSSWPSKWLLFCNRWQVIWKETMFVIVL